MKEIRYQVDKREKKEAKLSNISFFREKKFIPNI